MMAANYQHIGGHENRLGRHYSRFRRFGHPQPLPINHLLCENRRTQGPMGEVGLTSAYREFAGGNSRAQWKNVLSICVIPTRVIVEPSGRWIVVLPSLTLAVATTWSIV